jgi:hypothetical protein
LVKAVGALLIYPVTKARLIVKKGACRSTINTAWIVKKPPRKSVIAKSASLAKIIADVRSFCKSSYLFLGKPACLNDLSHFHPEFQKTEAISQVPSKEIPHEPVIKPIDSFIIYINNLERNVVEHNSGISLRRCTFIIQWFHGKVEGYCAVNGQIRIAQRMAWLDIANLSCRVLLLMFG